MLLYGVLCLLLAFASAQDQSCYKDVKDACGSSPTTSVSLEHCNAKFGGFANLEVDLEKYANANIQASFEYLMLSTHFGNYEAQREGFKKLYRKYSDKSWADAINVIKYITKRGGSMNFNELPGKTEVTGTEFNELASLGKALGEEKRLANKANKIHYEALNTHNDAAVAHYLEEEFLEGQTERIRDLAGYATELRNLLLGKSKPGFSIFLFDQHLEKLL